MESGTVTIRIWSAGPAEGTRPASMTIAEKIEEGESLRALLSRLAGRLPRLSGPIFDPETQTLSGEVAVLINDRIDDRGLEAGLQDGDRIFIFPYLAGG